MDLRAAVVAATRDGVPVEQLVAAMLHERFSDETDAARAADTEIEYEPTRPTVDLAAVRRPDMLPNRSR